MLNRFLLVLLSCFAVEAAFASAGGPFLPSRGTPKACKRGAGPLKKDADLKALKNIIVKAIAAGDRETLVVWASCDFFVGVPDEEVGGYRAPRDVMGDVVKFFKSTRWKTEETNYGSQVHIESVTGDRHLVFRRDRDGGWYWIGALTKDKKQFAKLNKGSYTLEEHED